MKNALKSLPRKAAAAMLSLSLVLAAGPVPSALAQVRAVVEAQTGAGRAPFAGQQTPGFDASFPGHLETGLSSVSPTLSLDVSRGVTLTPDAALQTRPIVSVAGNSPVLAPKEDKRDSSEQALNPETSPAPDRELGEIRDAVGNLPDLKEAPPAEAHSSITALFNLIIRQRGRMSEGNSAVPAWKERSAQGQGFPETQIAPSERPRSIPLPGNGSTRASPPRTFSPAIAAGFMAVLALLAVQAYLPAIYSSLGLLALTGMAVEEGDQSSPRRRLAPWRLPAEITAVMAAGLGLAYLFSPVMLPALAAALGTTLAIAAYVAVRLSGSWAPGVLAWLKAVVPTIHLKPWVRGGLAAGAGAALVLMVQAGLAASPWGGILLGMSALASGLTAMTLPVFFDRLGSDKPWTALALFHWRNLIAAAAAAVLGLGLSWALLAVLGVSPVLAGIFGLGLASAAIAVPRLLEKDGAAALQTLLAGLKSPFQGAAGAALGAGAVLLLTAGLAAASPWLALLLGAGAALASVASLDLPSVFVKLDLKRPWTALRVTRAGMFLRAAVAAGGLLLAWALLAWLAAPAWLAGLLGMGVAAGGFMAVSAILSRRAPASAAAEALQSDEQWALPADDAAPVDPAFEEQVREAGRLFTAIKDEIHKVVIGHDEFIDAMLLAAVVSKPGKMGHFLVEGQPGDGKTMSILALARSIDAKFSRIQFVPDLLPSDVSGSDIIEETVEGRTKVFKPGPVFAEILLADEVNRAKSTVHSALLEPMQEGKVTVGVNTHSMPNPQFFFVLATQNPLEQEGTYPLAEAHLDRFLFKLNLDPTDLGDPQGRNDFARIMRLNAVLDAADIRPVAKPADIAAKRELARKVRMSRSLDEYVMNILEAARYPERYGLEKPGMVDAVFNKRAGIALAIAARVRAMMQGRTYVTPDDIKALAPLILRHRIKLSHRAAKLTTDELITRILNQVPVDLAKAAALKAKNVRALEIEEKKKAPATGWRRWLGYARRIVLNKWTLLLLIAVSPLLIWLNWPLLAEHFPVLNDWLSSAWDFLRGIPAWFQQGGAQAP